MQYILTIGIIVLCAALGLILSKKIGLLDKPGPDIVPSRKPVPTLQGLWLYIAVLVSLFIAFPDVVVHPYVFWWLIVGWCFVVFTFVDELLSIRQAEKVGSPYLVDVIPSWVKLVVQLLLLALLMYKTWLYDVEILWWQLPLALWIVGTVVRFLVFINAINWFDYAYGQASGLSAIGFASIILLIQLVVVPLYQWISPETEVILRVVTVMSYVLCVASIIYTFVEYKPYWLLRDVGSWLYGFSLAYLSLIGGAKIGTILVVLSLPLFDFLRVILYRIFVMKKNPLKGDYTHLHHRLLALWWNKSEVRAFVWWWSCVMLVLMLLQWWDRLDKVIVFVMMAIIFFGVHYYFYCIKWNDPAYKKIKKW